MYTIKPLTGLAADDVFKSILDKNCVKKTCVTYYVWVLFLLMYFIYWDIKFGGVVPRK